MPLQRFDLRSARFDRLSQSVMFDARNCVVEIALDALEAILRQPVTPEDAVRIAVEEAKGLARLASKLPPDDGKIHITANIVMTDGVFGAD